MREKITLGDLLRQIEKEMERVGDQALSLKEHFSNTIKELERLTLWPQESSEGRIITAPKKYQYEKLSVGLQFLGDDGVINVGDVTEPLGGYAYNGTINDIIKVRSITIEGNSCDCDCCHSAYNYPLQDWTYEHFRNQDRDFCGCPYAYTLYGGRLLLYPTPDCAYKLLISGAFRVLIPTQESEYCTFLDELGECVKYGVKYRSYANDLLDMSRAEIFKMLYQEQIKALQDERGRRLLKGSAPPAIYWGSLQSGRGRRRGYR